MLNLHRVKSTCPVCGAEFGCKTAKTQHVNEIHNPVKSTTFYAAKVFVKDIKNKGARSFGCKKCDYVSDKMRDAIGHIKTTHLQHMVRCCFLNCSKVFRNKEQLELHFNKEHSHLERETKFR